MSELFWFLITAMVVITVHELGHLLVALWCRIPVTRFSVGFGSPIWSKSIHLKSQPFPLEVALAPIPLGGYVAFVAKDDATEWGRAGLDMASQPILKRALTLAAGPMANLLLAWVIWLALGLAGQPVVAPKLAQPTPGSVLDRMGVQAGDWVEATRLGDGEWSPVRSLGDLAQSLEQAWEAQLPLDLDVRRGQSQTRLNGLVQESSSPMPSSTGSGMERMGFRGAWSAPVIRQVLPGGAAQRAGLQADDLVVSINGVSVSDAQGLLQAVRMGLGGGVGAPQQWMVQRQGRLHGLVVSPERVMQQGEPIGQIKARVGGPPVTQTLQLDGAESAARAWNQLVAHSSAFGQALTQLFDFQTTSNAELMGPLGLAQQAKGSADQGWSSWWLFVASLSISVAWLNLLPLPVLDGGQLVLLGLERLGGAKLAQQVREKSHWIGVYLLIGLMAWAIYNDVVRTWFASSTLSR